MTGRSTATRAAPTLDDHARPGPRPLAGERGRARQRRGRPDDGPRRVHDHAAQGQLVVFDKFARQLVTSIILPIPTAHDQGRAGRADRLRQPARGADGRGPARPHRHRHDRALGCGPGRRGCSDRAGAGRRGGHRGYAGLRAATEHRDYQVSCHADGRYVCVGGIRSTGLTRVARIAEHVRRADGRRRAAARAARRRAARRSATAQPRRGIPATARRPRPRWPPTPSTAGSSASASGSVAARCATPWPASLPPARPRRPAPSYPGDQRPLPGLLLRRREASCSRPGRPHHDRRRERDVEHVVDVLVVGAGPAGLTAAAELGRAASSACW